MLTNSCGEHITFVDSDDWIGENHLEELMKFKEYDLVLCGYTCEGDSIGIDRFEDNRIYLGNEIGKILETTLTDYKLRVPWAKLYKKAIIEDNDLFFDIYMKIAEDTVFVQQYLCHCTSLCFINSIAYFYYVNKRLIKYKLTEEDLIYTLKATTSVFYTLSKNFSLKDDSYINFIECYLVGLYINNVRCCSLSFEEYKRMKRFLIQIQADKFNYQLCTLRQKIMYGLLKNRYFICFYLYLMITGFINKFRYRS